VFLFYFFSVDDLGRDLKGGSMLIVIIVTRETSEGRC